MNGMATHEQREYFNSFRPDLAILPELRFKDIKPLNPNSYIWDTNNFQNKYPKGLGILNFSNGQLIEFDRDKEMEIYIPFTFKIEEITLNILGVWNFYSACKQGRFKGVTNENAVEYSALKFYKDFLSDNGIVIGDWNLGPTQCPDSYLKITKMLNEYNIHSSIHAYKKINVGDETYSTFRHSRGKLHILDHIFADSNINNSILNIDIDDFRNVIKSDHAPILLELDINKLRSSKLNLEAS